MTDDEIRESGRPRGNVTPLPRMRELTEDEQRALDASRYGFSAEEAVWDPETETVVRRRVDPRELEPAYPDGPLASRGLTDAERDAAIVETLRDPPAIRVEDEAALIGNDRIDKFAELARATRQRGALSGVRLWMTWPGEADIAEETARAVAEYAERVGFSVLDVRVAAMEEPS